MDPLRTAVSQVCSLTHHKMTMTITTTTMKMMMMIIIIIIMEWNSLSLAFTTLSAGKTELPFHSK
jgi:hypothetical protein